MTVLLIIALVVSGLYLLIGLAAIGTYSPLRAAVWDFIVESLPIVLSTCVFAASLYALLRYT